MAGRLMGQVGGEGNPNWSGLISDQKVNVRDLIPLADKSLTDVHDDVAGHGVGLPG